MRECPITFEPLPLDDQKRIVSQTACNQLRVAVSNLADIMSIIDQMIAGAGRPNSTTHTQPGSKPPLNIGLLSTIDDDRDTIDIWANNLAQHVNPNLRYRPGDWATIQAILTQYADKCGHWTYGDTKPGVLCIQRVTAAIARLERIAFPPEQRQLTELERLAAEDRLKDTTLTIGPACEAVRLITGIDIKPSRVRKWKQRGQIDSIGEPPRYRIASLLDNMSHPTSV